MNKQHEALVNFGRNVRRLRIERTLSQEALGIEAELSQTFVSQVELGKRNLTLINIKALADALETTVSQLTEGI